MLHAIIQNEFYSSYMLHIGFKCTLRKDCIIDRSDFVYIQYFIGNTNWDFTEGIGMYAENPGNESVKQKIKKFLEIRKQEIGKAGK